MTRISTAARVLIPLAALFVLTACPPNPPQPGCSYDVTPTGSPMIAAGGNVLVRVTTTASCTWTYTGNAPWLTLGPDPDNTGGAPGTGNGSVILTVAANAAATRRAGAATVAGKTIAVDQAGTGGSGCTFQVSPTEQTFSGGGASSGQFTITPSAADCGWTATRSSQLEDTVNLTSGGNGRGNEERFGIGSATIGYDVKAKSATSPWINGSILVRDSAQQSATTYLVKFQ
jgi:hypothetical protein